MLTCKLRPHHGLCIAFFEGKGYSPDFVENMTRVIAALDADDPEITLTDRADVICAACPNDHGGVCESADKVARYDSAVLRLIGRKRGDTLHYSEFRALVDACILSPGKLGEVCLDCQWYGICGKK